MRLLICTQAVDKNDPVLGFFHRWLEEFAKHFERITVLCLREGEHTLPNNVRVVFLNNSRLARTANLLRYSLAFRTAYDVVLVHMSQEFVLAGGWLWKLLGKRVYLWRNHYAGSLVTDLAAAFCTKVFCTSKFSCTAKYKKTVLMPVGVDTELFKPLPGVERKERSILFLARMAPSKRPDILVKALCILHKRSAAFSAAFYGSPAPGDEDYYERLKLDANDLPITFHPAVPNHQTPEIYRRYELFINCSPSGMLDKTIFEAAACGCLVLAASEDWAELAGREVYFVTPEELAERLEEALASRPKSQTALIATHSLKELVRRLSDTIR